MDQKAYVCRDKTEMYYATVVFAETPGKARAIAQHTDVCEDVDWCNISVRRYPEMDNEYRGHSEMDWYDDKDRIALVKAGWHCEAESWECLGCCANKFCEKLQGDDE